MPEGVLVYEVVPLSGAYKSRELGRRHNNRIRRRRIKNYNELVDAVPRISPVIPWS